MSRDDNVGRSRSPGPGEKDAIQKIMAKEMDKFRDDMVDKVTSTCNRINEAAQDLVFKRLEKIEIHQEQQQNSLVALKDEQIEQGKILRTLAEGMEKLNTKPDVDMHSVSQSSHPPLPYQWPNHASWPVPPPTVEDSFFRTPDPTTLFLALAENLNTSKKLVLEALEPVCADASITKHDFVLHGEELGNKFELKFQGSHFSAKAKATQLLQSLRLGPGSWKPLQVRLPTGIFTNFYLNPDKSGSQVRKEILAKKLCQLFNEKVEGKTFFCRRADGIVFVDRRPLVKVVVESRDSSSLSWMHAKRIALGLELETWATNFEGICKEDFGESWS